MLVVAEYLQTAVTEKEILTVYSLRPQNMTTNGNGGQRRNNEQGFRNNLRKMIKEPLKAKSIVMAT